MQIQFIFVESEAEDPLGLRGGIHKLFGKCFYLIKHLPKMANFPLCRCFHAQDLKHCVFNEILALIV